MGSASQMHLQRNFVTEVAMIILMTLAAVELISWIGWSASVTSYFPSPFNVMMSIIIFSFSLLGFYGLLRQSRLGVFFALLTPVFEVILGGSLLVRVFFGTGSSLAPTIRALATIFLGTLTLYCAFKAIPNKSWLEHSKSEALSPLTDSTSKYAVEVIDAVKKYQIGSIVVPAINGLTMRVPRGEFVAVMGPSGCGKSTLLNLIGALDRPTSGRVMIDGIDISMLNEQALARLRNEKIGFVFQVYNLIARSKVLRNMELPALVRNYPKEERIRRINRLLTIVGLGNKASRKPKTLSGGEQQRVAFARALVNDPKIVLADEPTGNIDSRAGQELMGYLRKLNRESGVTIIVVTHNREVAEMADRIIHLWDGKITKEETVRVR